MGHVLSEGKTMADKEAQELLDTARLLRSGATNNGFDFLNNELDLSKTRVTSHWLKIKNKDYERQEKIEFHPSYL